MEPFFKKCQALHLLMRPANKALTLMLMLLLLTVSPASSTGARSVHSTSMVDLFLKEASHVASWSVGAETSFTKKHKSHRIHGGRPTLDHAPQSPLNLDTMTVWSTTSPTDSNYSTGAPDGAIHGQPVRR